MSEEQQDNEVVSNPKKDYKSYKLILLVLILIVGTICLIRKENVDQIATERFIKERIPVLNNFTFISVEPPRSIKIKLAVTILDEAKKYNLGIDVQPGDLKLISCKYRNNDTLYHINLYSGKEQVLFYLNAPEKVGF